MPQDGAIRTSAVPAPVVAGVVDLLVYVVVLNLFAEYFPHVISESFTLSLLTAVLLKAVLELVRLAKTSVLTRFRQADGPRAKAVAALLLWGVAFSSKFVVLELVNLVFGDRVSLGGFFSVTLLVVVLLSARAAVRWMLPGIDSEAEGRSGVPSSP
ncbi:hypothetical protein FDO65_12015 [Nakamurella flava]|uniref:Uncharacterized protein n=1 Tax=Nakamurella flava TaxID=2576308 RepID=A0A4U6QE94_9ACTN|nr:hypothetical protein [Nakamurella flava]TKV58306.1 hypothetical protein FDO65_12015 [Nakamurella flava]